MAPGADLSVWPWTDFPNNDGQSKLGKGPALWQNRRPLFILNSDTYQKSGGRMDVGVIMAFQSSHNQPLNDLEVYQKDFQFLLINLKIV